jgi:hypothetical protein
MAAWEPTANHLPVHEDIHVYQKTLLCFFVSLLPS